MTPEQALTTAREKVTEAHRLIEEAVSVMRENGWPDNGRELQRSADHLRVWILPSRTTPTKAWFDYLQDKSE